MIQHSRQSLPLPSSISVAMCPHSHDCSSCSFIGRLPCLLGNYSREWAFVAQLRLTATGAVPSSKGHRYISISTSLPTTRTLYGETPTSAGGFTTSPVFRSKRERCHEQVTVVPATSPSDSGPPR